MAIPPPEVTATEGVPRCPQRSLRGTPNVLPNMVKTRPGSSSEEEPWRNVPARRHDMSQAELTVEYPQVLIRVIPRIVHGADVGRESGRPGWSGAHTGRSKVVGANEQWRPRGLRMRVA